jgi:C-terminal processing protease CtpA/Prc
MTRDLDAQIRAVEKAKADVLLIDVVNNGGGTEWAEAAARMVTAVRLKSERMGFVRGPHWAKHFADTVADLRADAKGAPQKDQEMLNGLAEQVQGYQREAEAPCNSQPLWQRKRASCDWLGQGSYASGIIDSADPKAIRSKPWAKDIFTPIQYPYDEGVWRGPLIVLVNGGTGSAAEQFAAVLQDNHAAVVMGAPTVGAGCGHTNGGTPTTLKNSGGILELPDCARIRADGSNEVMGIQPDVLVGLRNTDGPHRQGIRVSKKLQEAIARALQIRTASRGRRDPQS